MSLIKENNVKTQNMVFKIRPVRKFKTTCFPFLLQLKLELYDFFRITAIFYK